MAQDFERLAVVLEAQVEQFRRDYARSTRIVDANNKKMMRSLSAFDQRIASTDQRLGLLGKRLIAIAGPLVMLNFAKRTIETADALGKMSQRAGVSVEALQRYRFAAEQSGATSRDLDDAVVRLQRRLGLFVQTGGGPAQKAIEALGLEQDILSGKLRNTEDVFERAIDLLSQIDDQALRSATASQLFGEDAGPRLVPLINQGTEGLRRYGDRLQELNGIMSTETVQAAEDLADELNELSHAWTQVESFGIRALALLLRALKRTYNDIRNLNLTEVLNPWRMLFGEPEFEQRGKAVLDELRGSLDDLADDGAGATRELAEAAGAAAGEIDALIAKVDEESETISAAASPLERYRQALEETTGARDAATDSQARLNQSVAESADVISGVDQGLRNYRDGFAQANDDIARSTERAALRMEDALTRWAQTGKLETADLVDFIDAEMTRLIAIKPLVSAASDALSGVLGSIFGGGGGSFSIGGGIGSPGLTPAMADGGYARANRPHIVGERGGELFIPGRSGRVVDARQTAAMGGGGVIVHQTINVSTGVQSTVRAEILQLLPLIEDRTVAAVADAATRGGGRAAAIRGR